MTEISTGSATLINGDCRTISDRLLQADIILTDPPYGIDYRVNERGARLWRHATEARPAIVGDGEPFDPAVWLQGPRIGLFGANHFAAGLPAHGRWVMWDKRENMRPNAHSDGEMVWLSEPREKWAALRIHRQKWCGMVRAGEENLSRGGRKLHPHQKPVALLTYLLELLGAEPGMVVADPYMGCGSTGVAALRMGCSFIGAEIDADHFRTAADRLAREQAPSMTTVA